MPDRPKTLEELRAEKIAEWMDPRYPKYVDGSSIGGTREEGQAYQEAQAEAKRRENLALDAQRAEERRLQSVEKHNADPKYWDGHVLPDGTVEFNDIAARQVDSEHGRKLREQLSQSLNKMPAPKRKK